MQFVPLPMGLFSAPATAPLRLGDSLAGMIASVGRADFGTVALEALNQALPLCWLSAYSLYDDAPPQLHLGGSYQVPDRTAEAFGSYRDGLYLRDQTFLEARQRLQVGDTALTHWHAQEIPLAHRGAIYTSHRLRERVSMVRRTQQGALLSVNLYRHTDQPGFGDTELELLQAASRAVLACLDLQLLRSAPPTAAEGSAAPLDGLPRREREVCERLLKGWTHAGIATDLGLSGGTVKTYRDRAFDRLGIHHRNELFALALRQLG